MADYQIVCVVRDEAGDIEAVGYSPYGGSDRYDGIWTVEEACYAIEQGHRLYTVSPSNDAEADLECYQAEGQQRIRTKPDQTTDNNLDSLPECEVG
ncbi:MAG TPA: DUF3892 domain-containing protein [Gaiellaceae bacterium]|nr:DUF3892 domain-containing protein [Gaiellaceae bacterium]